MAKRAEKTRVTRRTVIEETGPTAGEPTGAELDLDGHDEAGGADEAANPEEMDALAKLRDLSGGNTLARYEVRRVLPSAEAGYAGTLADEELTMERLAEEFGPGTYAIRVRLPGGKFAGSDRVQIADVPKHRRQAAAAPQAVVSPAPDAGAGVAQMVAAMQRSTDAQVTMLSSLVKSLIERPLPTPPPPPPPPNTLEILGVAAKLFDRKESGGGLDMFMKGLEFGKELGGGGSDMGDLLLKGLDGIKELSKTTPPPARRHSPAPGTVPALEAPAAAPAAQVQTETQQEVPAMNTMQLLGWLKKQVGHLLVQAARQKSPELYAEVFLDNLPPGLEDETLLQHLKADNAVDRLTQLDGRVARFRQWFEEFRVACVRMIEEGPDDEDEETDDEPGPDDIPGEFVHNGEHGGEG